MRITSGACGLLVVVGAAAACSSAPTGVDPGDDGGDQGSDGSGSGSGSGSANGKHGPYPIVLAHGMFGFDHIGPLDYFYGVGDVLTGQGRKVYTPRVDPTAPSEVRGPELQTAVDDALVDSGADKVVIIAHSQGGLDARWVAHYASAKVAAIVTIATPHRGTSIADVADGILPGSAEDAIDDIVKLFELDVSTSDLKTQLADMTTPGSAAFSAQVTDSPDVAYYSIAGRSNHATDADAGCDTTTPFLAKYNSSTDPMQVALSPMSAIMTNAAKPAVQAQDGLVAVDSARWGTFLGCIPADHFDEVCQIAGASPGDGNKFDCHAMYSDLERFLRESGY